MRTILVLFISIIVLIGCKKDKEGPAPANYKTKLF